VAGRSSGCRVRCTAMQVPCHPPAGRPSRPCRRRGGGVVRGAGGGRDGAQSWHRNILACCGHRAARPRYRDSAQAFGAAFNTGCGAGCGAVQHRTGAQERTGHEGDMQVTAASQVVIEGSVQCRGERAGILTARRQCEIRAHQVFYGLSAAVRPQCTHTQDRDVPALHTTTRYVRRRGFMWCRAHRPVSRHGWVPSPLQGRGRPVTNGI
jgi:hypothetical protein